MVDLSRYALMEDVLRFYGKTEHTGMHAGFLIKRHVDFQDLLHYYIVIYTYKCLFQLR